MHRKPLSRMATGLSASAAALALGFGVLSVQSATAAVQSPTEVNEPTTSSTPTASTPSPSSSPSASSPSPSSSTSPPPKPTTTTPPPKSTPEPSTKPTPKPSNTPKLPWEPKAPGEPDNGPRSFDPEEGLSTTELAKQIATADQLWSQITAANTALSAALKELQAMSTQSNALLETLADARASEQAAKSSAAQAKVELGVVQGRLERARAMVREWAFQAYSEGGSGGEMLSVLDALQAEESEVGDPLGDLSYLTDEKVRAVDDVRTLAAQQKVLTENRAAAQAAATKAAATIVAEKKKLDVLVKAQQAKLTNLQKAHSDEVAKAGPVVQYLVGIQTPEAKAAYTKLSSALGKSLDTSGIGKPCSNAGANYPNGLFPTSALCPLWQAPGEMLQPRAAAAFNAMSQAYAKQSGSPICVTDSYRTLSQQYVTKAKRGRFAARPGTSRHGLGLALDLCGGINNFGSPAHLWMKQNAPLYGWFHPSWAAPNAATPEPWHWEYSG